MNKIITWFFKACVSGLLSVGVLTGFCMLYYNVPVHSETEDNATDYSWEHNKFYSRATEGFAWGKTNNEGYLNPYDYSENKDIDILVMGSSHMEAYQVAMDESTASVLRNLLPDHTVYNIGTSGHDFLVCADNMTAAINKYKPTKYVILETSNLLYTTEQLTTAINETVPDISSVSDGIVKALQKNQFLRLLYSQFKAFRDNSKTLENSNKANATPVRGSDSLYNQLLSKLSNTVSKNGAKLIIVHHSSLRLNEDGSVSTTVDNETSTFFANVCKQNDVLFLDMSDVFLKEYQENHVLPHGFSNSSVGHGHLNKNGHESIAKALYKLIKEEE